MLADLLDRMTRADQLALGGCVDAVVTRAGDGRRGDPEVHLLGTCLADQLDQGAAVVPRTMESSTTTTFLPSSTSRTGLNLIFTLAMRPACAGWMNVRP